LFRALLLIAAILLIPIVTLMLFGDAFETQAVESHPGPLPRMTRWMNPMRLAGERGMW